MDILLLLLIGLVSGVSGGLFGIGGGIIIVPCLVQLVGFSQHRATGTSLALMLPPIGLAAVLEYYRRGDVDIRAALIVGAGFFVSAWLGSAAAGRLSGPMLKFCFGLFLVGVGIYTAVGAARVMWAAPVG
jgi:uncharacterized protein